MHTIYSPILSSRTLASAGQHYIFHHFGQRTIAGNHNGVKIFFSQFKGQRSKVSIFLYRIRSQYDGAVVTMAAAFGQLEIVALRTQDFTISRAGTHYIYNNRRQASCGHIAHRFAAQRKARAGGSCHASLTSSGNTSHHIKCRYFRFSLNKHKAFFGCLFCIIFWDFT